MDERARGAPRIARRRHVKRQSGAQHLEPNLVFDRTPADAAKRHLVITRTCAASTGTLVDFTDYIMYSRDEIKALIDKVLNLAKADAVEVSFDGGE